ncbi:MAG TPA: hypothetical protein DDX71_08195 [Ruminococcus sp.]|nr:hypothetical protein [Ruminococcus sp.]
MEQIRIRAAQQADMDACCEMLAESRLGEVYYPSRKMIADALEKAVSQDSFLVAVNSADEPVGFIWYQARGMFHSFPYLHMIVVRSDQQHTGIGRKLMQTYEQDSLRLLGALRTKAYLLVADFNDRAFEIYRKNGYELINQFDGLFRRNVNERLMVKTITRQANTQ